LAMPEPMGKLDTVEVNGPEDEIIDWDAVDWRRVEDAVRRLRQRIFTATQAGDLIRVRNLQKLMLGSRANALLSARRVTELNAGRKTAGVDGRVVLAAWEKAGMAAWLQRDTAAWRPRPVKRVFTHTAEAVTQTAPAGTSTLQSQLRSLRGLLEPVAWKAGMAGS